MAKKTPYPHFLDINAEIASDPTAPYAVLPVPYERTVTYGHGAADGPAAILRASHEIEDLDEEFLLPMNLHVQTLPPPAISELPDQQALDTIRTAAEKVLQEKRFLLTLGGEHTISAPIICAAAAASGPISVLHVDAHLDQRDQYEGTRLSHACAMRRVSEAGIPIVHVGMRSCSAAEYAFISEQGIPAFRALDINADLDEKWTGKVLNELTANVYVSFDIDAFDPGLVHGTGTPEPGGLSWQQATHMLRLVFSNRTVVAADIVETAPVPGSQVSEFVAARLGAKMLMYHKQSKP